MTKPSTVLFFLTFTLLSVTNVNAGTSSSQSQIQSKDCASCNLETAQDAPAIKELDTSEKTADKASFEEEDFKNFLYAFCMKFERITNPYAFKVEILKVMKNTPYSFEKYWTQAECRPDKLGATLAPIVHLAADEAYGRRVWLETLYNELKDEVMWKKIVNSKNTEGQTVLDYIVFGYRSKMYRPEEIEDVNKLSKFLCETGATFAIEKDQKCPLILK